MAATRPRCAASCAGSSRAGWRADLAALYVDLDNGFDAFAPDNSRRTLTDRPGRDAQRSGGVVGQTDGRRSAATACCSTTAYAHSDSVYSFDGDWGNDPYWGEFAPYDYFSHYDRERGTLSQDLRVAGGRRATAVGWLAGVYALRLDEDSLQRDEFAGELLRPPLAERLLGHDARGLRRGRVARGRRPASLTAGLRVETRSADYSDSDGAALRPRDTMVGGQLSLQGPFGRGRATGMRRCTRLQGGRLQHRPVRARRTPASSRPNTSGISRPACASPPNAATRCRRELAVFHMWREDQQVATSFQLDPGDPLSYVFYTDNAARGRNYGLEASVHGSRRPSLLARRDARPAALRVPRLPVRRPQSRRPRAGACAGLPVLAVGAVERGAAAGWRAPTWAASPRSTSTPATTSGRNPYVALNLRAGYARGPWSVHAWGRNVNDADYAVRGFYFGLEPPDFAEQALHRSGATDGSAGITLQWRW